MYDLDTGKQCLQSQDEHCGRIYCVKFLKEKELICSGEGCIIKTWKIPQTFEHDQMRIPIGSLGVYIFHDDVGIRSMELLSDDLLISSCDNGIVAFNSLESDDFEFKHLEAHSEIIYDIKKLSLSRLVTCSSDKQIKLWDLNTFECLRTFTGHDGAVSSVQLLSDERIVSGSEDETIKIWSLKSGDCLQTLKGHTSWVWCVNILSDEKIISGSLDKTVKIWCLRTNSCIMTLSGHLNSVRCIEKLSRNKVATGSDDKTVKIWDLESGACIQTIKRFRKIFAIKAY